MREGWANRNVKPSKKQFKISIAPGPDQQRIDPRSRLICSLDSCGAHFSFDGSVTVLLDPLGQYFLPLLLCGLDFRYLIAQPSKCCLIQCFALGSPLSEKKISSFPDRWNVNVCNALAFGLNRIEGTNAIAVIEPHRITATQIELASQNLIILWVSVTV